MIEVVMLWLINDKGELLLARRADHKTQDPGLWGPSVTGKVEPEETFEQALVRESDEELSLLADTYTYELLFKSDFAHPDGVLRRFEVYAAKITEDVSSTLQFDTNEVAEIKWLPVAQVKELLNSKPGEMIVASAFVLWKRIFDELATRQLIA